MELVLYGTVTLYQRYPARKLPKADAAPAPADAEAMNSIGQSAYVALTLRVRKAEPARRDPFSWVPLTSRGA